MKLLTISFNYANFLTDTWSFLLPIMMKGIFYKNYWFSFGA